MMESTPGNGQPSRRAVQGLAQKLLDEMAVTEGTYHDLRRMEPLVVELLMQVQAAAPTGRVLVIGPNETLAAALQQMGYSVDLWRFPVAGLPAHGQQMVTPEQLAQGALELPAEGYDAIVLPLVLEGVPGPAEGLLAWLGRGLRPGGGLILAGTNPGRLSLRLRALAGKAVLSGPAEIQAAGAPGWLSLPALRLHTLEEMVAMACRAGFQVQDRAYTQGCRAFSAMDDLDLAQYAGREASYWLKRLLPPVRDYYILRLSPRMSSERAGEESADEEALAPMVSVVVSAGRGGAALRDALSSLLEQSYPGDRYEVLVLHDGRSEEVRGLLRELAAEAPCSLREVIASPPEGPAARNLALREARGEIVAHTDEGCQAPPDWLQAGGAWCDAAVGAVTGPVRMSSPEMPIYVHPPGAGPVQDDYGLYSIVNVFHRREAALAVGGFDEAFPSEGVACQWGWDTELAWRMHRQGWELRFRHEVFLLREAPRPPPGGWAREQWEAAQYLPQVVRRAPELRRRLLWGRCFASRETFYFDLLLLGLLRGRRRRWWLLLALPWLTAVGYYMDLWPPSRWRSSGRLLAMRTLGHGLWLAGLLRGSAKARRLVL